MQHKEVTDRQLEALLERIDRLTAEVARINRRLEASERRALRHTAAIVVTGRSTADTLAGYDVPAKKMVLPTS